MRSPGTLEDAKRDLQVMNLTDYASSISLLHATIKGACETFGEYFEPCILSDIRLVLHDARRIYPGVC